MPLNTQEILSLVTQLSEEEGLQVTVQESAKGGLIAGGSSLLGGLLFGPVGLAIGGTLGGLTATYLARGKFASVATVIGNMSPQQKRQLADKLRVFLQTRSVTDAGQLVNAVRVPALKILLIQLTISFLAALGSYIYSRIRAERPVNTSSEAQPGTSQAFLALEDDPSRI